MLVINYPFFLHRRMKYRDLAPLHHGRTNYFLNLKFELSSIPPFGHGPRMAVNGDDALEEMIA